MAECPVCNSRLYTQNVGIPFINFRRIFGCGDCGWSMDVDEVHKRGGLDNVRMDLIRGNQPKPQSKLKPPRNKPKPPRHKPKPPRNKPRDNGGRYKPKPNRRGRNKRGRR